MPEDVGAKIAARREELGVSLSALADVAGLSKGHLWEIEKGRKSPTVKTLRKIADAFGVDPAELL